jgi:hypothetical protein
VLNRTPSRIGDRSPQSGTGGDTHGGALLWWTAAQEQSRPEQCPEGRAVAEGAVTILAAVRGAA